MVFWDNELDTPCPLCFPIDLSSLLFWQQLFQFLGGALIVAYGSGRPTGAEECVPVESMVWLVIQ